MQIKKGTYLEIGEVALLWEALIHETMPQACPNKEWWIESERVLIQHPDYIMYYAEDGGQIIGFGDLMFIRDPAIGEVVAMNRHMYIKPEYRNGTVGGLIHRKGVQEARRRRVGIHRYMVREKQKWIWESSNCRPLEIMYEEDRRNIT